jgi:hypothetical protein
MLLKIQTSSMNFKILVTVFILLSYIFILPASVLAATAAEKSCDDSNGGKYKSNANVNACVAGFNAGQSASKTFDTACASYTGAQKNACQYGYGKGACSVDNPNQKVLGNCLSANPIIKDINLLIDFLSAGAGIVIVGSIIFGGIQYAWAGNNPNEISSAKNRIRNALIALAAFFFIFAFLQWLVPGGLLFS